MVSSYSQTQRQTHENWASLKQLAQDTKKVLLLVKTFLEPWQYKFIKAVYPNAGKASVQRQPVEWENVYALAIGLRMLWVDDPWLARGVAHKLGLKTLPELPPKFDFTDVFESLMRKKELERMCLEAPRTVPRTLAEVQEGQTFRIKLPVRLDEKTLEFQPMDLRVAKKQSDEIITVGGMKLSLRAMGRQQVEVLV